MAFTINLRSVGGRPRVRALGSMGSRNFYCVSVRSVLELALFTASTAASPTKANSSA